MIDETNTPTERPAQGGVEKPIKLHAGYVGRTRAGERVFIPCDAKKDGSFWGSNSMWYNVHGICENRPWINNIIGPWTDPKEKATEYKPDTWYAWTGGECPVHEMDRIEYVARIDLGDNFQRRIDNDIAGGLRWRHDDLGGDIMLFKIVEPYVEPRVAREWFITFHSGSMKECWADASGAIRVREVLE